MQKAFPLLFPVTGKVFHVSPLPKGIPRPFFSAYGCGDWGVVSSHSDLLAAIGRAQRRDIVVSVNILEVDHELR